MTALPAPDGLAALQRDILVAVAALVVHCARVDIDLLLGLGGVGVVASVLLCGHFGVEVCECGRAVVDLRRAERCIRVSLFSRRREVARLGVEASRNCSKSLWKAEWRRAKARARALSIVELRRFAGALSHGDYVRTGLAKGPLLMYGNARNV